jgi:hypothetical protein
MLTGSGLTVWLAADSSKLVNKTAHFEIAALVWGHFSFAKKLYCILIADTFLSLWLSEAIWQHFLLQIDFVKLKINTNKKMQKKMSEQTFPGSK